ncbi:MAG: hypothetical protein AAGP08_13850 [Pseudomonadota bacterium]
MAGTGVVIKLENQGRLVDPETLSKLIKDVEGQPVAIDALGAPLFTSMHLQLFLSAKKHWEDQGLEFGFVNVNDQFQSCLTLLGYSQAA